MMNFIPFMKVKKQEIMQTERNTENRFYINLAECMNTFIQKNLSAELKPAVPAQ